MNNTDICISYECIDEDDFYVVSISYFDALDEESYDSYRHEVASLYVGNIIDLYDDMNFFGLDDGELKAKIVKVEEYMEDTADPSDTHTEKLKMYCVTIEPIL